MVYREMHKIKAFNFPEGKILAKKYEIIQQIGSGWEGEVYLIREIQTGIERAAKFFFPEKNIGNKTLLFYARKLHKLRHCPILIKYHTQEILEIDDVPITFLISEYIEGRLLSEFIASQKGKRLHPYQALHLLHSLVKGVEDIHRIKEYHGDIHSQNIILERYGLGFELKLVDMFRWNTYSKPENIQDDIVNMITVFYESLGGKEQYHKQSGVIKSICCGLKKSLILKKFRTSTKLREHLETLDWN